ncbi:MAG: FecR domain-containing protein [Rubrivivax sp.]|nr:FecR domain-containing protein [Rubrivivax sp.]
MTAGRPGRRAGAPLNVLRRHARRLAAPWLLAGSLLTSAWAQPAPAALPADTLEWRVQAGDTLIGLSRRLLTEPQRWPELVRANGLRDANRIAPGSLLRIPRALVRSEAVAAELLSVGGQVQGPGGAPLQAGARLDEGTPLLTGKDGNATVRLVDGTVLRLRADSRLQLRESRRYPGLQQQRSSVQLEQGRVEVQSPRSSGGQPGFEVHTPQGVLGVRGTEFRVAADGAARRTLGEVLEGAVGVAGARGAERVDAGFGSVVDASGAVTPPAALLAPPDLGAAPRLQQRVLVRVEWPALAGAAAYRGQVARDAGFDTVLADIEVMASPLRVANLPDGDYVLRLRARDAQGLEGRAAELAFTLKARPEAPLPAQPVPGARLRGRVDFRWAANPEARLYRLQVARDPAFADTVLDRADLTEPQASAEGLAPGRYHWRLTSLRSATDAGPPGETLGFELLATPPPAAPPGARVDEQGVSLAWPGQPGQLFDLQVARDAGFEQTVLQRRLDSPGLRFDPPGGGRFHVRLRTIEADGYVGPYGAAQFFDVPPCLRTAERACVRANGEPVLTLP